MQVNRALTRLDLTGNRICAEGAVPLFDALKVAQCRWLNSQSVFIQVNATLIDLRLSYNNLHLEQFENVGVVGETLQVDGIMAWMSDGGDCRSIAR